VQRSYKEDDWGDKVSSVQESVKRGLKCVKLMLEAVTREQMVKTQQAGKGSVGNIVTCKSVEISNGAIITGSYKS
jgi:hypothetical protein